MDYVYYGNTGVCQIMDITDSDQLGMPSQDQKYYVLKPLYSECMIYTPVNTSVFMRPVITAAEAEHLIDMIPQMRAEAYHNRSMQQLTEHYEASINAHDCKELIGLTMSIYAKKEQARLQKRKIGQVDERYMKQAQELLWGELSLALGIPKDKVQEYIFERVGELEPAGAQD